MNLILLPIAVAATVLTYAASHQALKNHSTFESPRLIAGLVALLSGLSLLTLGGGVAVLILLPYAALGLALLFLGLMKWLIRSGAGRELGRFLEDAPPTSRPRLSDRQVPPVNRPRPTSAHLRKPPPREE